MIEDQAPQITIPWFWVIIGFLFTFWLVKGKGLKRAFGGALAIWAGLPFAILVLGGIFIILIGGLEATQGASFYLLVLLFFGAITWGGLNLFRKGRLW